MSLAEEFFRGPILRGLVAIAGCCACAQDVVEWKVSTPLVLVPCGRGVEKRTFDKIHAATSNLQEFVCSSNAHADSCATNGWTAVIQSVRDADVGEFRGSTNRLDYVAVAAFYEAVAQAAHVAAKENVEESVKVLTVAFDAAISLAGYDPSKQQSGFGAGKNFQTYRQGQSDGRSEMLRSWAEEGKAFRKSILTHLLPRWWQIIGHPDIQSSLGSLPVERRTVILHEIARVSRRIRELTLRCDIQEAQTGGQKMGRCHGQRAKPQKSCAIEKHLQRAGF